MSEQETTATWAKKDGKRPVCLGALALAVLAGYGLPLLLGWSWIPVTNTPLAAPLHISPSYPPGADTWSYSNVEAPWRAVERWALGKGEFPLWNPYSSLGVPLAAQYENQLFLQFEWIEILASPRMLNLLLLFKIYVAGLGCHLVLARWLRSEYGALAGTVYFIYTPPFVWFYSMGGFIGGAVLLPWLYLCLTEFWDGPRLTLKSFGSLAFVVGMSFLVGQPQIAGFNVFFALVCVLIKVLCNVRRLSWLRLVCFVAAIVLGVCIASVQLGLFEEAMRRGHTMHYPDSYVSAGTLPLNFSVVLWPFLFGQVMSPWNPSLYPESINWEGFPVVFGATGLFFSALGIVGLITSARLRNEVSRVNLIALAGVGAAILLWVVVATLGCAQLSVPFLNRMNFARYTSVTVSFVAASMVGLGAVQFRRLERAHLAWALCAMCAVMVACGLVIISKTSELVVSSDEYSQEYWRCSLWLGLGPFVALMITFTILAAKRCYRHVAFPTVMWCVVIGIVSESFFFVRMGLGLEAELARSLFVVLGCVSALLLAQRREKCGVCVMITGFVLLACLLARTQHHLPRCEDVDNVPGPHIAFLQDKLGKGSIGGRVLCSEECVRANSLNYHNIADLAGNQPVQTSSTAAYILRLLPSSRDAIHYCTPNQWWGMSPARYNLWWTDYVAKRRFMNLLSVKYLLDETDGYWSHHAMDRIKLVYEDARCRIYEDEDCSPRAYACVSAVVVEDHEQALDVLSTRSCDFKASPVIEDPLRIVPDWLTRGEACPITELKIGDLSANRVAIPISIKQPALVVLNDSYYPGWRAYVDGVEKPVLRVNSVCRGVIVDQGATMVEFVFRPRLLMPLALVSATSFAMCVALMSLHGIRQVMASLRGRPGANRKRAP